MNEKEIMSEEAFKELIDNLEIVEKLTPYGRKAIKYWVNKLQKENEELKSDNLEKERVLEIFDNRKYRKRYLKERRKEEPNLLYPDGDEIYKRYYELKKQIDLTIEYFLNELHKYTSFGEVAEFCKNKKSVECYKTKCSICIKEYFSKLAKEKGE